MKLRKKRGWIVSFCFVFLFVAISSVAIAQNDIRFERLKSRFKRGVDYYRDGPFTISSLSKHRLSQGTTAIKGFLTNDTTKRAVSVQLEITCYNEAGDFLDSKLTEVNYLNSRGSQSFQAKFRKAADKISLFEVAIQDVIWDEF